MLKNKIAYKLTIYIILLSVLIILLTAILQLYLNPLITNAISILLFALIIGWIFHTQLFRHLNQIIRDNESNAQNLLNSARLGLGLWRSDGKLLYVNPAYAQIIGREVEETLPLNYWKDILVGNDATAEQWQLQALKTGEHYGPVEKEYRHKDGYHVPVRLSALILKKEGEYYIIWSHIEDLSRQKWEARELQHAKQKAEDANIAKSQFIANMSYELRTCMNSIIGYTEMLEEDCEQPIMRQDIKNVHIATKQLLGLIDGMLDISQIEAGNLPSYSERFDLKTVIQNTVTTLQPLIENNANALHLLFDKDLGEMYTDLIKVRQILFNMLSNASKFTKQGIITLEVRRELEKNGDWINIRVSDEGSGMNSKQRADLYQVFTSNTRKYGSTGLALSLTKQFAEKLGGSLNIEGVFDKGNHFIVRLPAHISSQPSTTADEAIVKDSHQEGELVLAIDDDKIVREMLDVYLSKVGYQVVMAASGEEGLKLAKKLRPNTIILDVMMPGMDGWEVLSKLKASPELAHIPVIMLTMTEAQEIGYSLGAAEYMTKPVPRTQLINVLRKYRTEKPPPTVMVLEDDQLGREMVVGMLKHVGWQVIDAGDGETALQLLEKHQPDLILSDLNMPDMNGFEFITHLRQHKNCSSTRVVVVTAKLLTTDEELWLNEHVDAVFQKGTYSYKELLAKLRQLLV